MAKVKRPEQIGVHVPAGTLAAIKALPGSPAPGKFALAAVLAALAREQAKNAREEIKTRGVAAE